MCIQINQHLTSGFIADDRAYRHFQHHVVTTRAIAIRAAAILTALRAECAGVAVIHQCVQVTVGLHINTATLTTVPAVGAAHRLVFLTTKRGNTVPAISGIDFNGSFVDKFHMGNTINEKASSCDEAFCVSFA